MHCTAAQVVPPMAEVEGALEDMLEHVEDIDKANDVRQYSHPALMKPSNPGNEITLD